MEEEKAPQEEEVRIAPQEEEEKKEAPHKIGLGEEQELQDMQQQPNSYFGLFKKKTFDAASIAAAKAVALKDSAN